MAEHGAGGLAVSARDLGVEGPRGWAFRGVRVEAGPGSLIAIEGPSGSGRTCLLLALTGRMKATEGTAVVGDARLPKQMAALRRVSALAHVPGVTDLDPSLTVGEHLRERVLLQRRFGDSLRGLLRPRGERRGEAALRIDAALTAAGLDRDALPKGLRTAVRDLERLEALRLSVALALIGRPRLLGVDDTDLKLSEAERAEVWALLRSLAAAGTTVLAVCSEAPEDAVAVSTRAAEAYGADGDGVPPRAGRTRETDEADEDDEDDEDGLQPRAGETDEAGSAEPSGSAPEPGTGSERADRAEAAAPHETPDHPRADDEVKETADAVAETGRA
ncbi:ATP-binding cassette domain-containing protein [Streptomyces pharetrae]|uniref:ATP-binding cassette domain-containing protein n=1 Tax=Streptomyces pharetrae TaxID=291370 RepID=UPI00334572C1